MDAQAAYFAGFFDGEGSVFEISYKDRHGKGRVRLTAKITQVDRTPLDLLRETLGCGSVQTRKDSREIAKNWQTIHEIVFSDRSAREFLVYIEPYLIVKKEKVTGYLNKHGRKF